MLFAPAVGAPQAGLRTPATLFWTYQTIQGLSDRLGVPINSPFAEGQEPALASVVVTDYTGVVLIC